MLHFLNADLYRIRQERLSFISMLVMIAFSFLFAYLYREDSAGAESLAGAWTTFLPLFFVTPAKIFLGEDLTTRTINNSLIKTQNRFKVFVYKWGMTLIVCWLYLGVVLLATGLAYQLFSGQVAYEELLLYGFYQLPLYTVIASLCAAIFAFFNRIYQSYMVYLMIALLFDQLVALMAELLFQTDRLNPYLMFSQLSQVAIKGNFFTQTSLVALLFTIIYAIFSYVSFKTREFK